MAERKENSVLFSLRELRQIEDDRVKTEEEDVKRREEEARQKLLAEERAKLEAAERARREAMEAEQRRLQAEELRLREEQLRLEEAERLKRLDHQAKLEQERLRLEIEAKTQLAARRKPWGLIISASVLLVLVAGLGIFLYVQNESRKRNDAITAQREEERARQDAEWKKNLDDQVAQMRATDEEKDKLVAKLKVSQDATEQKRLQDEIAANRAKREAEAEAYERTRQADIKRRSAPVSAKKCANSTDPLCGI